MPLRLPAALAFTIVGGALAGAAASCGDGKPGVDAQAACPVACVPADAGPSQCPPPTCATGDNHDMCPPGCVPEPIAWMTSRRSVERPGDAAPRVAYPG